MLRYAITRRTRFPGDEAARQYALLEQAVRLAEAGVDFLQLREKDMEAGALASLAHKLLVVLRSHARAPKLLINSRADVAIACGADGVHLTSARGELTPANIRRLYSSAGLPEPVVSMSCHTLGEIPAAREATLILFGPVFEKVVANHGPLPPHDTLVSDGVGLNLLRMACAAAAPTPVLALGGITLENISATLEAGAAGIAAIRLFSLAPHELQLETSQRSIPLDH
jgi:thiamine-phosphate pyrophosphorylase